MGKLGRLRICHPYMGNVRILKSHYDDFLIGKIGVIKGKENGEYKVLIG